MWDGSMDISIYITVQNVSTIMEPVFRIRIHRIHMFLGLPDPDPPDPHVFGPPGSGSTSQRYGSGSFYHQAKIVRKPLIPTVLQLLLDF